MGYKKLRVEYETLRSLAAGSIGAAYAAVGTAFANPIIFLKIQNKTDKAVFISKGGTADHDILGSGEIFVWDLNANKQSLDGLALAIGQRYYAKDGPDGTPTSGSVYLTCNYAG